MPHAHPTTTDVLVVGAGPTGLTLALDLSRWGLEVRVIERSEAPQTGSRGCSLKPRTLEVFDDLGVADALTSAGRVVPGTRLHAGGKLLADVPLPVSSASDAVPHPNTVVLPQWRTEAVLRAALAQRGVEVEFGTTLTEFTGDAESVTARIRSADRVETIRADYLVGCDGGRSTVRSALGLPFNGTTDDSARVLVADAAVTGLEHEATHLWLGSGADIVAMRPGVDGSWQVVAAIGPDEEPSAQRLQQLVTERTGDAGIRIGEPTWLSTWRYNQRMVDRYRVGRVLLAGDAAHVHSPFGSFGINTGVQDAHNLAWKLALTQRGLATDALLDTYEGERLPVGRSVLAESDRALRKAIAPPKLLRPFVRAFAGPLMRKAAARRRIDRPSYRDSPLSWGAERGALRAGDAVPDGTVRLRDREVRLFDLFRGPHATVLAFGAEQRAVLDAARSEWVRGYVVAERSGGADVLGDPAGTLRSTFGEGTVAVVRPDGHIGLLARGGSASGYIAAITRAPSASAS